MSKKIWTPITPIIDPTWWKLEEEGPDSDPETKPKTTKHTNYYYILDSLEEHGRKQKKNKRECLEYNKMCAKIMSSREWCVQYIKEN